MNIYDHFAHEDEYQELNIEAMSERLAKALSFKTVYTNAETTDWSQFDALQQHIVDSFPYVMTAASNVEVVGHSLLIEIPGSNPKLPALMLIAHQDVVPVVPGTEDAWTHDPFGGDVDDTYVWGRGALDIKDMLMGELEALEYLLSQGFSPRRSIYLAFGEDEEVLSHGATRLAEVMASREMRAACLLDEGTTTFFDGSAYGAPEATVADICISQKGFLNVKLTATGHGGHSSNPFGGTSLEHLSCALATLSKAKPQPELNDIVKETFKVLAPEITEEPFASLVHDVDTNADKIALAAAQIKELYPFVATTYAFNMLEGSSSAANVMPGNVSATINIRLLPGVSVEKTVEHIKQVVAQVDPSIEVEALHSTPAGRIDSPAGAGYQELKAIMEHYHPGVTFVPSFVCGGTDSVRYEGICDSILRICPFRPTPEDEANGVHGIDERIEKRVYAQGVRVLVSFVKQMCE